MTAKALKTVIDDHRNEYFDVTSRLRTETMIYVVVELFLRAGNPTGAELAYNLAAEIDAIPTEDLLKEEVFDERPRNPQAAQRMDREK